MRSCTTCGAPLPARSPVCSYCRARNDVDLTGLPASSAGIPHNPRNCPRCRTAMESINIATGQPFVIERCTECRGLFFDPGELEVLLENATTHVYHIDHQLLGTLNQESALNPEPVTYLTCPLCSTLMNRVNFGARSGVVVDKCRDHGVWLDNGELFRLQEWVKAGGLMLHQQRSVEHHRLQQQQQQQRHRSQVIGTRTGGRPHPAVSWLAQHTDDDLLGLLGTWVKGLFFE